MNRSYRLVIVTVLFLSAVGAGSLFAAIPAPAQERLFATPEEARDALVAAVKAKDQAALTAIFGPEREKLMSGDAVEDNNALEHFGAELEKAATLEKVDENKYTLKAGDEHWPMPIPIVKQDNQWRFDTAAGEEEILNRRIGRNELSTIGSCRAYALAQWEYFSEAPDICRDGLAVYAQKFISTPGKKDGLYWATTTDQEPSPLGSSIAEARAEGYGVGKSASVISAIAKPKRLPYHGYYYKILTRQGPHAPGGKFSYLINGNMIAGYALIAYPDKWGSSGIQTFIINQQGRVYEKNLGPQTEQIAAGITEYDPDLSWKLVTESKSASN